MNGGYQRGTFAPHLVCRFIGAKAHENSLAQEPLRGPTQIDDFGNELRLDPMHARKLKRRAESWRRLRMCGQHREPAPPFGDVEPEQEAGSGDHGRDGES